MGNQLLRRSQDSPEREALRRNEGHRLDEKPVRTPGKRDKPL
jgi:hypothetical protein